jgi:hypothetical protein
MAQETPQSKLWRKQNDIEPWRFPVPVQEVHRNVRVDVKKKQSRIDLLKESYGLFGSQDVATVFKMAIDYYSDVGLVLVNEETREYKRVSLCSRWDLKHDSWYKKRYYDMRESLEGMNQACMISIGYDQKRMYEIMLKDGWHGDFYGYLMSRITDDIAHFLKRLRSHRKRKKLDWNYLGYAIEPHEGSGIPHIHLWFSGNWVASIDDIVKLWGWSQAPGIKVTVRTGKQIAGYLASYLKKGLNCIDRNRVHLMYAYAYFFKVPLYRIAYGKRKEEPEDIERLEMPEDDYPAEKPFKKDKWACVGSDVIGDQTEWDGRFKPFKVHKQGYEEINNLEGRIDIDNFEKLFKNKRGEIDEEFWQGYLVPEEEKEGEK